MEHQKAPLKEKKTDAARDPGWVQKKALVWAADLVPVRARWSKEPGWEQRRAPVRASGLV